MKAFCLKEAAPPDINPFHASALTVYLVNICLGNTLLLNLCPKCDCLISIQILIRKFYAQTIRIRRKQIQDPRIIISGPAQPAHFYPGVDALRIPYPRKYLKHACLTAVVISRQDVDSI